MNDLIIWKEEVSNNNLQELGKAFEIFTGCKHLIVTKNVDKRAVVMFKNDKNQVSTVITTKTVNKLLREKRITPAQLLGLPVLRGRIEGAEEDTLWLSLPATGWREIGTVEEITNYEEYAV